MSDEIYKNIWYWMYHDFGDWEHSDEDPRHKLWDKVKNGTASSKDAFRYAEITAEKWSEILEKYLGAGSEWLDRPTEEITQAIKQAYARSYQQSGYYAQQYIERVNKEAGVSLKAVAPVIDDRLDNLIAKMSSETTAEMAETFVNAKNEWMLSQHVSKNIAVSAVSDTIRENSKKTKNAGLAVYMVRKLDPSGCCRWCQSMAGTYDADDVPKDFWRFHHDCGCWIEYHVSKKAFTRVSYTTYRDENGNKRLQKVET